MCLQFFNVITKTTYPGLRYWATGREKIKRGFVALSPVAPELRMQLQALWKLPASEGIVAFTRSRLGKSRAGTRKDGSMVQACCTQTVPKFTASGG